MGLKNILFQIDVGEEEADRKKLLVNFKISGSREQIKSGKREKRRNEILVNTTTWINLK